MDEADDLDGPPGQHALDPRQRVVAAVGVEQVAAGEVAEAVAQCDQAAERADGTADERLQGIAGAQQRGGEVEHRIVRADRDDRAFHRVEVAQQPDLDLCAGVVAFGCGGHDEQPVGAHERGEDAGAAGQRRRHEPAADAAEADADPVVGTERGGQPACEPCLRAGPLDGRRALERGEQRDREDVERQRGGDRVARCAEHRVPRRSRAPRDDRA